MPLINKRLLQAHFIQNKAIIRSRTQGHLKALLLEPCMNNTWSILDGCWKHGFSTQSRLYSACLSFTTFTELYHPWSHLNWLHLKTVGHLCTTYPTLDQLWPSLTALDHSYPSLTLLDHSWPSRKILNNPWPLLTIPWPSWTFLLHKS